MYETFHTKNVGVHKMYRTDPKMYLRRSQDNTGFWQMYIGAR